MFVGRHGDSKLTGLTLSQWLEQPRDSKVALCGRVISVPVTVGVPATFSNLFSPLTHGPDFPNKPRLTLEARGTAPQSRCSQGRDLHRTLYIQDSLAGPARMNTKGRGRKRAEIRHKHGRRPMPPLTPIPTKGFGNPEERNTVMIGNTSKVPKVSNTTVTDFVSAS